VNKLDTMNCKKQDFLEIAKKGFSKGFSKKDFRIFSRGSRIYKIEKKDYPKKGFFSSEKDF